MKLDILIEGYYRKCSVTTFSGVTAISIKCPSIRHSFVRSISLKVLKVILMKLDTLLKGYKEKCRVQEP